MFKRIALYAAALVIFSFPTQAFALGFEIAVGMWQQTPTSSLDYRGDTLELEGDLGLEGKEKPYLRARLDMPLLIPNLTARVTPYDFSASTTRQSDFTFGGTTFSGSAGYKSALKIDEYDLGVYYGIPMLETATLGMAEADLGVVVRFMQAKASITGTNTAAGASASVSKDIDLIIPMGYARAAVKPLESLSFEAELRLGPGVTDALGRVKYAFLSPAFVALGYRDQRIAVDEEGLDLDVRFSGVFVEAGVEMELF